MLTESYHKVSDSLIVASMHDNVVISLFGHAPITVPEDKLDELIEGMEKMRDAIKKEKSNGHEHAHR